MPEETAAEERPEEPEEVQDLEAGLRRLEELVRGLEDGDTSLEEAVARYQEGVRLLQGLHRSLERAGQEVRRLTEVLREDIARLEGGGEGEAPAEEEGGKAW